MIKKINDIQNDSVLDIKHTTPKGPSSSGIEPNVIVPRQILEIFSPLLPRKLYSTIFLPAISFLDRWTVISIKSNIVLNNSGSVVMVMMTMMMTTTILMVVMHMLITTTTIIMVWVGNSIFRTRVVFINSLLTACWMFILQYFVFTHLSSAASAHLAF